MKNLALAAVVMVAITPSAAAQHSDYLAVYPGHLALWDEGYIHAGAGVTWSKQVSRNWAVTANYSLMKRLNIRSQVFNFAWAGVERSFGPQDEDVPYLMLGAVGFAHEHSTDADQGFSVLVAPGFGFGFRHWNAERTWFTGPEFLVGVTGIVTVSFGAGFGLAP